MSSRWEEYKQKSGMTQESSATSGSRWGQYKANTGFQISDITKSTPVSTPTPTSVPTPTQAYADHNTDVNVAKDGTTDNTTGDDNWRNSIRSEEEIRAEMEEVDRLLTDNRFEQKNSNWAQADSPWAYIGFNIASGDNGQSIKEMEKEKEELQERYRLLNEELNFSKYFVYGALPENEDFEQMSRPGESKQGGFFDRLFGGRTEAAYDYINNIDGYGDISRAEVAARHAEGNADYGTGFEAYDYMTDEQKKTFNYIYNTQGKEPAAEYLKWLEAGFATNGAWVVPSLNAQHGLDIAEKLPNDFQKTAYGLSVGLDQWGSGTIQLFNKDAVPTSAVQYAGQAARDELGKVGRFIYDAGMVTGNMLPSIAISTITAGAGAPAMVASAVGSITLGASAGGNAYNQALKEGYAPSQARTYGTLVGASEASLQYLLSGIGKLGGVTDDILLKKIAAIDKAWARMALTGVVRIGSEVTEENLQEFIEPAIRSIIFEEKYDAPNIEDLAYTFLLTVLTTGLMEGGNIISAGSAKPIANISKAANGKIALESGLNSAYDKVKTGELENGAEEIHLRESGQRADGSNTGGQVSPVEEGTGGNPGRETGGRNADSETAALTYGREVSAASLGIDGGTDKANVRLVTGGDTTATRAAKQMAREHNLQLVLFAGDNLEIRQRNGSIVSARALIDGDKVYVRADHAEFTAVQLMGHETGHNRIARGEIDPNTVRRRIRQTFGGIKTVRLAAMYAEAYAGTGMTASEVWEEVICDSLGDMNIFAGTAREARAAQLLSAAKAASADAQVENIRGPPAENKFSRSTGRRAQRGRSIELETMENNRFERLRQFYGNPPAQWYAFTRDYFYVYSNQSYMDYTILVKAKINSTNSEHINSFTKELENGTIYGTEAFDNWTSYFRRGKGRNSWYHISPSETRTTGQNDGVDVRAQGSKHGGNSRTGSRNIGKIKYSREKFPVIYTEQLLKQAKKNGNLYTQRLLQMQMEKAQRADELQRLIKEAEEVLSEESVYAAEEEPISADARDKLGEITARGTTKIKQGFSAFSKDDILFERAKLVRPDGNKFDVAMHGTSQSVAFGGREVNMSPRLLAAIIKHNKDYSGQEIRLLSCNTGKKTDDDYCFAEELANALGVTVYAPNDLLIFNDDGTLRIGRSNLGRFVPYGPNERRRLK